MTPSPRPRFVARSSRLPWVTQTELDRRAHDRADGRDELSPEVRKRVLSRGRARREGRAHHDALGLELPEARAQDAGGNGRNVPSQLSEAARLRAQEPDHLGRPRAAEETRGHAGGMTSWLGPRSRARPGRHEVLGLARSECARVRRRDPCGLRARSHELGKGRRYRPAGDRDVRRCARGIGPALARQLRCLRDRCARRREREPPRRA